MQKIFVIGGGASGLVASIYAKTKENQVTILERNSSVGKKILVTGNGRCNYWNVDQDIRHYYSENQEILLNILTEENKEEILNFFEKIGIVPKIKNGYYYPCSNQARTIQNTLLIEALKRGVEVICDRYVLNIRKEGNKFLIITENEEYVADKVILATGSIAYYQQEVNSYDLAGNFSHSIHPVQPSLVQLIASPNEYLKKWAGIRTDVAIKLLIDNEEIKRESGEIQLTDYGISGICVFNVSRFVSKALSQKHNCIVQINFVPFLSSDVMEWLDMQNKIVYQRTIEELLEAILNYKLVRMLLKKANVSLETKWDDLSLEAKMKIVNHLTAFEVEIIGTKGFGLAQVCSGGVSLENINSDTMESKLVDNLFLVGELLDVDGDCGGYNLSFAWISGMLAGKECRK